MKKLMLMMLLAGAAASAADIVLGPLGEAGPLSGQWKRQSGDGFDRTRENSGKSAQEIAEAARGWGQNDDITVVNVRRKI